MEKLREESTERGQAQRRHFRDRRSVSVGYWQLKTGSQRSRVRDVGAREAGARVCSRGDFHSKQEKPRGFGSVLEMDEAASSLLYSFVQQTFSVLFRDGDRHTDPDPTLKENPGG